MSSAKDVLYQGKLEGPVRKCHRMTRHADYLEQCEKFEEAIQCHEDSAESLMDYIKTRLTASSKRQVGLLLRRHQTRIIYLRKKEEEKVAEATARQSRGLLDCNSSADSAAEESASLYFAGNPTLLHDINRSHAQFNATLEQLHRLAAPEDVTRAIDRTGMVLHLMQQSYSSKAAGSATAQSSSKATAAEEQDSVDDILQSSISRATAARCGPGGGEAANLASAVSCRSCNKTLEDRLNDEDKLVKMATELPTLWRSRDRQMQTVLSDYCSLARSRDGLREHVKQLTAQLERVQIQLHNTQCQLMNCSNITYNTTATDPDSADLTTSDCLDNGGVAAVQASIGVSSFVATPGIVSSSSFVTSSGSSYVAPSGSLLVNTSSRVSGIDDELFGGAGSAFEKKRYGGDGDLTSSAGLCGRMPDVMTSSARFEAPDVVDRERHLESTFNYLASNVAAINVGGELVSKGKEYLELDRSSQKPDLPRSSNTKSASGHNSQNTGGSRQGRDDLEFVQLAPASSAVRKVNIKRA